MKSFYSNGKLLLTGEYAVLDGALSLALPTKYGQLMTVNAIEKPQLIWRSFDESGALWFEATFSLDLMEITFGMANPISQTLANMLKEAKKMNPEFLTGKTGYSVMTKLDFSRNWGLGTSSTLINNIAQWTRVDAFELLNKSFGGSGYDIACAQNSHPILYRLKDWVPHIQKSGFNPSFKNKLYFIHLNKKQNSREEIERYSKQDIDKTGLVENISSITDRIANCNDIMEFETLLGEHETLLSNALNVPMVKESHFPDFKGVVKSLGAWGGDFILATGSEETPDYFKKKGYETVIRYEDMVLQ
ncbi:MAG: GYDIA family GHMP kinase [Aurantibacter sp.]